MCPTGEPGRERVRGTVPTAYSFTCMRAYTNYISSLPPASGAGSKSKAAASAASNRCVYTLRICHVLAIALTLMYKE